MATLAKATNKVDAPLESGTYAAKIKEIKEMKDSKFGPACPFVFEVDKEMTPDGLEDLDDTVELVKLVSIDDKVGPKSTLYKVATAALGRELEEGEGIDTDDLEGKRLMLTVEKVKKDNNTYSNITNFAPFGRKKKSAEPVAAAATGASEPARKAAPRQAPDVDLD